MDLVKLPSSYILVAVDDYSDRIMSMHLPKKSDSPETMDSVLQQVFDGLRTRVSIVRSDGGGEFFQ